MEFLLQDIKFGIKLLAKNWGFSITAILTLTLCIAANTSIFSVVNSVLLEPLPIPDSDQIVVMYNSYPGAGVERASNGVPDYYDRLTELDDVFEEQAFYNYIGLTVGEKDRPERLLGMAVTPSFFRLIRTQPLIGRNFNEEEGEQGNERKVILSYASWQEIYGGAENVLGKDLRINGNPFTIVGVLPQNFLYLNPDVRLWIPLAFSPQQKSDEARHNNNWENIGRLRANASLDQVDARLKAITAANLERVPEFKQILINAGFHVQSHFLKDDVVRQVRGTLYLLWAGVLFVLLIGCVNITNLILVRTSVRIRELTTRFAIGASRWRVARQLLTESVLMTLVGGVLGLMLGYIGLRLLSNMGLSDIPRGTEIAIDTQVLLVILTMTLVVGLLIGVLPILQVIRWNTDIVFREDTRTGTSSRGVSVIRKGLVVAQIGIALVLLVGATLLLESFTKVLGIDTGFRNPDKVLTGSINAPNTRYKEDSEIRSFYDRVLESVRSQPGVISAGATSSIPFGGNFSDSVILAEGYTMEPGESLVSPSRIISTPGYFEAMGIPLKQGRLFDDRDTVDSQLTIIVDERLAKKFWPDLDPIGRRMYYPESPKDLLAINENTTFYTVIGVVGSVKLRAELTL